jgi:hypothetical protein
MDEQTADRIARIRAELREFDKAKRDRKLRAGKAMPKTYRECDIFASDLLAPRPAPRRRKKAGDTQTDPDST